MEGCERDLPAGDGIQGGEAGLVERPRVRHDGDEAADLRPAGGPVHGDAGIACSEAVEKVMHGFSDPGLSEHGLDLLRLPLVLLGSNEPVAGEDGEAARLEMGGDQRLLLLHRAEEGGLLPRVPSVRGRDDRFEHPRRELREGIGQELRDQDGKKIRVLLRGFQRPAPSLRAAVAHQAVQLGSVFHEVILVVFDFPEKKSTRTGGLSTFFN